MIDFQFPNKKIQNQPSTDDRVNKIKRKTFKFNKKKKKNSQVEYEVLMIVLIYCISLILTIQNLKDSNK